MKSSGIALCSILILSFTSLAAQFQRTEVQSFIIPGSTEAVMFMYQRLSPGGDEIPMIMLPPGNDACASATTLTVGAGCITGTSNTATTQGGEYLCISPGGGITPETAWYRFTASNDSLVLGFVMTNFTNCATVLAVYGPFAPGGGCLPGAGSNIMCQNMGLIDPGFHPLLTGLTIGQDYLVQVQGNNCGGGNDRFVNYCISIANPATNIRPSSANVISSCGFAFSGTTAGGYFNNGTSIGSNNLDNNNATSCAGASEVGDDVTFVINNCSWFSFCNGNAGACNWSVNVAGITGCLLPVPNDGVQAAVFSGTPAALTNLAMSPSRIAGGSSWNSGSFSLAAGACAYIMVDGFAGDQCNYTLTLTNVSCPCVILPVDLAWYTARDYYQFVELDWGMASEDDIERYDVERSSDAMNFTAIGSVEAGDMHYKYKDRTVFEGWVYYRLRAISRNGESMILNTISVNRNPGVSPLTVHCTGDQLMMQLEVKEAVNTPVRIFDIQGREVASHNVELAPGMNSIALDAAALPSGIYFLRAGSGTQAQVVKFVKP